MYFTKHHHDKEIIEILDRTYQHTENNETHFNLLDLHDDYTIHVIIKILNHYEHYGIKSIYILTNNLKRINELKKNLNLSIKVKEINSFRQAKNMNLKNIDKDSLLFIDRFDNLPKSTTSVFKSIQKVSNRFNFILGITSNLKNYFSIQTVIQCSLLSKAYPNQNQFLKHFYNEYKKREDEIFNSDRNTWMILSQHDDKINEMVQYLNKINSKYINRQYMYELQEFITNTIHTEVDE